MTLKRFLLHYLLQFANGLLTVNCVLVSFIRLSFIEPTEPVIVIGW